MHEIIFRDHLLVVAGARAAYMDCAGLIDLETDLQGEETLAKFLTYIVDRYVEMDADTNFDEYLETNLILAFSKDGHLMKGAMSDGKMD